MNAEQRAELIALFEQHAKSIGAVRGWCDTLEATLNAIRDRVFADGELEGGDPAARVLFASPVTGKVGDVFGGDWFDATGYGKQYGKLNHYHTGVDLNRPGYADSGSNVYATADGKIVFVGKVSGWEGDVVVIEHVLEDGRMIWTRYAHIYHSLQIIKDMPIKRGAVIGVIADYGGDGPKQDHLHYDVAHIDLGSKPGDWPGLDGKRVSIDYIDPVEWHTLRAK